MDDIKELKNYFLELASNHYINVKKLNLEEQKQKVLLQECYQFNKFFESVDLDWRPTKEMKERIVKKELLSGLYPNGELINFKNYLKYFGVEYLKRLYIQ